MADQQFVSEVVYESFYLVVDVGLAWVAPHRDIRETHHQGMTRRHAMHHHVLINKATTKHLGFVTGKQTD